MNAPLRTVHCTDGLQWLADHPLGDGHAVLTSLPDSSELRRLSFAEWERWFVEAAAQCLRAVPERSAAIFFQTDVKRDGRWIDKGFLLQRGAVAAEVPLLWHKIVCRAPAGTATRGRPGYAHLLCFSRGLRDEADDASADVLPQLGAMTWPKAIGLAAAELAVAWLQRHASARVVVDPFCGIGTVLAVANRHGLDAIGIDIAAGRAEQARLLQL